MAGRASTFALSEGAGSQMHRFAVRHPIHTFARAFNFIFAQLFDEQ